MDVDASTGPRATPIVAVTGVSGYLGSWCAKLLSDAGYEVRGTVRSKDNAVKVAHLAGIENLTLYEADLLKEGSFLECFTGATYVLHTASPFQPGVPDPQKQLVEPALKGTQNVLNCALKAGVIRVVVTSSCAAVQTQDTFRSPEKYAGKVFTEADWNDGSTIEEGPYRLSKYLAEKAAWEFWSANKAKMELSVILPSFIVGPPLSTRVDSVSVKLFAEMLGGKYAEAGFGGACFGCIDVRDCARAHLEAMTRPCAVGKRFVLSSEPGYTHLKMAQVIKADPGFKDYNLGDKHAVPVKYTPRYGNAQAKKLLGQEFHDPMEAVKEACRFIVAKGLIIKATSG